MRTRRLKHAIAAALMASVVLAAPAHARLRAPALQGPADAQRTEILPTFNWERVGRAQSYEFQLAADKGFGFIVLGRGRGAFRTKNTAATIQDTLPEGTYYWRVRGISPKDRAGRWSPVRSFERAWTTAPQLLAPSDALAVAWPTSPLVLRWSAVPRATKYLVTIASDPSLASPVVGTTTRPIETQGTVFALPGALASGRYYWAVTPVDGGGHKGAQSRVGAFTWTWPSETETRVVDLNPAAEVFDPLLEWDSVPGAARYDIEVNFTAEFTPGSKVYSET